jgi:hypothetical protein
MKQHWIVVALAALLAACGDKSEEPEKPMPIEESVFADQIKALERAKDQAHEMEGRKQDLDSQLDAAEDASADSASDSNADGRRD